MPSSSVRLGGSQVNTGSANAHKAKAAQTAPTDASVDAVHHISERRLKKLYLCTRMTDGVTPTWSMG